MLSIRMQRLGRKGHPTYRVVVQDSRQTPTSGKYIALLGSYDPHTKSSSLVKDKAEFYLNHGAQPSERVVALFKSEKITLPKWVKEPAPHSREIRNPEKLRKNQPEKPAEAEKEETPQAEAEPENEASSAQASDEVTADKEEAAATEEKNPEASEEAEQAEPEAKEESKAKPAEEKPEKADESASK